MINAKIFSVVVVAIVSFFLLGLVFSFPVMLLWNYALVPAVPALAEIDWLQAWGIIWLCAALFKSSNFSVSQEKEKVATKA